MLKSVQDTANFFSDFSTATITKKKKLKNPQIFIAQYISLKLFIF